MTTSEAAAEAEIEEQLARIDRLTPAQAQALIGYVWRDVPEFLRAEALAAVTVTTQNRQRED